MSAAYLPRTIQAAIERASAQFPVLLLSGPRQVGKTTVLKAVAEASAASPPRRYVTLDDPTLLALALEEPALFLQRFAPPLLIDEIQYAPGLLPHIKQLVDTQGRNGLVWLTGSQPLHLMRDVGESLAGRVAIMQLQGLSVAESVGKGAQVCPFVPYGTTVSSPDSPRAETVLPAGATPLEWTFEHIWQGAFPAMYTGTHAERDLFYSSYLHTYVQRDVRDLTQVGDLAVFTRFVRAAAARTGQLLNMADMARDVGIAPNTAKQWLSVLQASGLVWLLEPYHTNLTKRLVKAPKLYFLDTGLAAYLTQWTSPATLEAGAMAGALFETWVVAQLLKTYWHNAKDAPLYFYRDKDQKEVDVLLVRDGVLHPIEIKKTAHPTRDAVRHFTVLGNLGMPVGQGTLISLCPEVLPLTATVQNLPAWQVG
jgi:uncharacterized protein